MRVETDMDRITEIASNAASQIWISAATIKVEPDQMIAKAASVKTKINNIRRIFESLEQRVNASNSYWKGEAGDMYRNKYKEFKDATEEIIKRLEEHVTDLNAMAGVYENAENEAVNIIEDLPVDVIS